MLAASVGRRVGPLRTELARPREVGALGDTDTTFEPSRPSPAATDAFWAWATLSITSTPQTPINTPRRVRPDRSLWATRASKAICMLPRTRARLDTPQRFDWIEPCGAPRRVEAERQTHQQRRAEPERHARR